MSSASSLSDTADSSLKDRFLHAARQGNLNILQQCQQEGGDLNGASPHLTDKYGKTPLQLARSLGYDAIATQLIHAGAHDE